MTGEGLWISQNNIKNVDSINDILRNTIILSRNHIRAVIVNLEGEGGHFPFPINREEYNSVYKFYNERLGLEGKARELILLILTCGYGYIRFRVNLRKQQESVILGTGQVDAKTILIARTLFKYLNTDENKTIVDDNGDGCVLRGSQQLDDKHLIYQSYQKLLNSNYSQEERNKMFEAVPSRHQSIMREVFGIEKVESSYLKAKADIDFKLETSVKDKPVYVPSPERLKTTHETGKWVYNVGEMLKSYKLTLSDIKKFARDDEYQVIKEYLKK